MHERSLVQALIRQVEEVVREERSSDTKQPRITEVCVAIGPLSGVEPVLVQNAFQQLKTGSRLAEACLKMDETPLQASCRDCGALCTIESFQFVCSVCRSRSLQVVSGDEFKLLAVTVDESHDQPAEQC